MKLKVAFLAGAILLGACDASTGPGNGGKVAIKFGTGTTASAVRADLSVNDVKPLGDELTVTGTNGTLVIQDVRFIVEEMKLRGSESLNGCGEDEDDDDDRDDNLVVRTDRRGGDDEDDDEDECEFEGGPFVVDLPLNGDVTVTTEDIPAGTYDRLTFKVDDLEGDDDDEDDDRARTPDLLNQMRTVYPNFPSRATLVVQGTQNGQPFTVYFRSKMRITQAISPPLVVPGNSIVTVKIDPSLWFKNGNQVLNLLAFNGKLIEFGNGFGNGIKGTRRGDDD